MDCVVHGVTELETTERLAQMLVHKKYLDYFLAHSVNGYHYYGYYYSQSYSLSCKSNQYSDICVNYIFLESTTCIYVLK